MLLSMQKKLSCMVGELHEGIVDAGTVADAVLDIVEHDADHAMNLYNA